MLAFSLDRSGKTGHEILGQPERWAETREVVQRARPSLSTFLAQTLDQAHARVILTGAGTSAFAGQVLAPMLARHTGRRFDAVATTDIVADPFAFLAEQVPTLIVSFARSGNSPESAAATALADQLLPGVRHLIITCDAGGQLALQHTDRDDSVVLAMPVRCNDQGFAMTSSFTSMVLAAIDAFLGPEAVALEALQLAASEIFADASDVVRATGHRDFERIVYLGSGSLTGAAEECALKLLELTAGDLRTMHDSPLGFRHGPKSVVNDRTLVVVLLSEDPYTRRYDLDLVRELATDRIGDVLVLTASALPPDVDVPHILLPTLEGLDAAVLSVPYVVFAQCIAVAQSIRAGITPDNPSPSGTVNRVVQGVVIHPLA